MGTSQEAAQLQAKVQSQLGQHVGNTQITDAEAKDLVNQLYAAAGRGSFGVFTETLRIPRDVNIRGIKATCHKGCVSVTLPKTPRHEWMPFSARQFNRHPQMPLSARQSGRHP